MSIDLSPMKEPQHIVIKMANPEKIVGWFDGGETADHFAEVWAKETSITHRVYAARSICKPE